MLLKGLIPRDAVLAGRQHIVEQMNRVGWASEEDGVRTAASSPPMLGDTMPPSLMYLHEEVEAGAGGDPAKLNGGVARFRPSANEVGSKSFINDPAVKRVVDAPEMHFIFQRLLCASEVSTLDYKWLRMMLPHQTTSFHVDHCFFHENYRRPQCGTSSKISQRESDELGLPHILTAWLPWHDTNIESGGLAVLRGSNCLPGFRKLRQTYCAVDVSNTDIVNASFFTDDPRTLRQFDKGAQWVTTNYRAGDVLAFGMHTFHGGVVNNNHTPSRVRLSTDIRFFPSTTTMDPRYSVPRRAQRENVYAGSTWRTMAQATEEWEVLGAVTSAKL
eukprot:SAG31_NODE_2_length_46263_cov_45.908043_6_plen_330_part_00